MTVLLAFSLCAAAGLATGVGGLISVIGRGTSQRFLAASLAFAAGVMVCVSVAEIIPNAAEALAAHDHPLLWTALGLIGGASLVFGLMSIRFQPRSEELTRVVVLSTQRAPEHVRTPRVGSREARLLRLGGITAFAIALHNLPEGFATFLTAIHDPAVALPVIVAIALHNIPEGIAIAVPIHHATGSRRRGFLIALASGLAEPAGALLGYAVLAPFLTPSVFGAVFAAVAGIMLAISLVQLIPTSLSQGGRAITAAGVGLGVVVMGASLLLMSG